MARLFRIIAIFIIVTLFERISAAHASTSLPAATAQPTPPLNIPALLHQAQVAAGYNPFVSAEVEFSALMTELTPYRPDMNMAEQETFSYLQSLLETQRGDIADAVARLKPLAREAHKVELQFYSILALIQIYTRQRDYFQGSYWLEYLNYLDEKITTPELRAISYLVTASTLNQFEQFEDGKRQAEIALQYATSAAQKCRATRLYLEANYYLGAATDTSRRALGLTDCAKADDKPDLGFIHLYSSLSYTLEHDYNGAMAYLRLYEKRINMSEYPWLAAMYHSVKGQIAYQLQARELARDHLQQAIQLADNLGQILPKIEAHKALAQLAEDRQDYKDALRHLKAWAESDKVYLNEVAVRELAINRARFESLAAQREINELNQENTLLKVQRQLTDQKLNNDRLLFACLLLSLLLLLRWAVGTRRYQKRLEIQAQTDELTQLANRHHFNFQAKHTLRYCQQNSRSLCLILLDVDRFKQVNDNYGHPTGDWVLKMVATEIRRHCRDNDLVARIGGEEFAILLAGCELPKALEIAERCRVGLTQINTSASGHDFSISASFGVTSSTTSRFQLDGVLKQADVALYKAKEDGRNQVAEFTADMNKNTA